MKNNTTEGRRLFPESTRFFRDVLLVKNEHVCHLEDDVALNQLRHAVSEAGLVLRAGGGGGAPPLLVSAGNSGSGIKGSSAEDEGQHISAVTTVSRELGNLLALIHRLETCTDPDVAGNIRRQIERFRTSCIETLDATQDENAVIRHQDEELGRSLTHSKGRRRLAAGGPQSTKPSIELPDRMPRFTTLMQVAGGGDQKRRGRRGSLSSTDSDDNGNKGGALSKEDAALESALHVIGDASSMSAFSPVGNNDGGGAQRSAAVNAHTQTYRLTKATWSTGGTENVLKSKMAKKALNTAATLGVTFGDENLKVPTKHTTTKRSGHHSPSSRGGGSRSAHHSTYETSTQDGGGGKLLRTQSYASAASSGACTSHSSDSLESSMGSEDLQVLLETVVQRVAVKNNEDAAMSATQRRQASKSSLVLENSDLGLSELFVDGVPSRFPSQGEAGYEEFLADFKALQKRQQRTKRERIRRAAIDAHAKRSLFIDQLLELQRLQLLRGFVLQHPTHYKFVIQVFFRFPHHHWDDAHVRQLLRPYVSFDKDVSRILFHNRGGRFIILHFPVLLQGLKGLHSLIQNVKLGRSYCFADAVNVIDYLLPPVEDLEREQAEHEAYRRRRREQLAANIGAGGKMGDEELSSASSKGGDSDNDNDDENVKMKRRRQRALQNQRSRIKPSKRRKKSQAQFQTVEQLEKDMLLVRRRHRNVDKYVSNHHHQQDGGTTASTTTTAAIVSISNPLGSATTTNNNSPQSQPLGTSTVESVEDDDDAIVYALPFASNPVSQRVLFLNPTPVADTSSAAAGGPPPPAILQQGLKLKLVALQHRNTMQAAKKILSSGPTTTDNHSNNFPTSTMKKGGCDGGGVGMVSPSILSDVSAEVFRHHHPPSSQHQHSSRALTRKPAHHHQNHRHLTPPSPPVVPPPTTTTHMMTRDDRLLYTLSATVQHASMSLAHAESTITDYVPQWSSIYSNYLQMMAALNLGNNGKNAEGENDDGDMWYPGYQRQHGQLVYIENASALSDSQVCCYPIGPHPNIYSVADLRLLEPHMLPIGTFHTPLEMSNIDPVLLARLTNPNPSSTATSPSPSPLPTSTNTTEASSFFSSMRVDARDVEDNIPLDESLRDYDQLGFDRFDEIHADDVINNDEEDDDPRDAGLDDQQVHMMTSALTFPELLYVGGDARYQNVLLSASAGVAAVKRLTVAPTRGRSGRSGGSGGGASGSSFKRVHSKRPHEVTTTFIDGEMGSVVGDSPCLDNHHFGDMSPGDSGMILDSNGSFGSSGTLLRGSGSTSVTSDDDLDGLLADERAEKLRERARARDEQRRLKKEGRLQRENAAKLFLKNANERAIGATGSVGSRARLDRMTAAPQAILSSTDDISEQAILDQDAYRLQRANQQKREGRKKRQTSGSIRKITSSSAVDERGSDYGGDGQADVPSAGTTPRGSFSSDDGDHAGDVDGNGMDPLPAAQPRSTTLAPSSHAGADAINNLLPTTTTTTTTSMTSPPLSRGTGDTPALLDQSEASLRRTASPVNNDISPHHLTPSSSSQQRTANTTPTESRVITPVASVPEHGVKSPASSSSSQPTTSPTSDVSPDATTTTILPPGGPTTTANEEEERSIVRSAVGKSRRGRNSASLKEEPTTANDENVMNASPSQSTRRDDDDDGSLPKLGAAAGKAPESEEVSQRGLEEAEDTQQRTKVDDDEELSISPTTAADPSIELQHTEKKGEPNSKKSPPTVATTIPLPPTPSKQDTITSPKVLPPIKASITTTPSNNNNKGTSGGGGPSSSSTTTTSAANADSSKPVPPTTIQPATTVQPPPPTTTLAEVDASVVLQSAAQVCMRYLIDTFQHEHGSPLFGGTTRPNHNHHADPSKRPFNTFAIIGFITAAARYCARYLGNEESGASTKVSQFSAVGMLNSLTGGGGGVTTGSGAGGGKSGAGDQASSPASRSKSASTAQRGSATPQRRTTTPFPVPRSSPPSSPRGGGGSSPTKSGGTSPTKNNSGAINAALPAASFSSAQVTLRTVACWDITYPVTCLHPQQFSQETIDITYRLLDLIVAAEGRYLQGCATTSSSSIITTITPPVKQLPPVSVVGGGLGTRPPTPPPTSHSPTTTTPLPILLHTTVTDRIKSLLKFTAEFATSSRVAVIICCSRFPNDQAIRPVVEAEVDAWGLAQSLSSFGNTDVVLMTAPTPSTPSTTTIPSSSSSIASSTTTKGQQHPHPHNHSHRWFLTPLRENIVAMLNILQSQRNQRSHMMSCYIFGRGFLGPYTGSYYAPFYQCGSTSTLANITHTVSAVSSGYSSSPSGGGRGRSPPSSSADKGGGNNSPTQQGTVSDSSPTASSSRPAPQQQQRGDRSATTAAGSQAMGGRKQHQLLTIGASVSHFGRSTDDSSHVPGNHHHHHHPTNNNNNTNHPPLNDEVLIVEHLRTMYDPLGRSMLLFIDAYKIPVFPLSYSSILASSGGTVSIGGPTGGAVKQALLQLQSNNVASLTKATALTESLSCVSSSISMPEGPSLALRGALVAAPIGINKFSATNAEDTASTGGGSYGGSGFALLYWRGGNNGGDISTVTTSGRIPPIESSSSSSSAVGGEGTFLRVSYPSHMEGGLATYYILKAVNTAGCSGSGTSVPSAVVQSIAAVIEAVRSAQIGATDLGGIGGITSPTSSNHPSTTSSLPIAVTALIKPSQSTSLSPSGRSLLRTPNDPPPGTTPIKPSTAMSESTTDDDLQRMAHEQLTMIVRGTPSATQGATTSDIAASCSNSMMWYLIRKLQSKGCTNITYNVPSPGSGIDFVPVEEQGHISHQALMYTPVMEINLFKWLMFQRLLHRQQLRLFMFVHSKIPSSLLPKATSDAMKAASSSSATNNNNNNSNALTAASGGASSTFQPTTGGGASTATQDIIKEVGAEMPTSVSQLVTSVYALKVKRRGEELPMGASARLPALPVHWRSAPYKDRAHAAIEAATESPRNGDDGGGGATLTRGASKWALLRGDSNLQGGTSSISRRLASMRKPPPGTSPKAGLKSDQSVPEFGSKLEQSMMSASSPDIAIPSSSTVVDATYHEQRELNNEVRVHIKMLIPVNQEALHRCVPDPVLDGDSMPAIKSKKRFDRDVQFVVHDGPRRPLSPTSPTSGQHEDTTRTRVPSMSALDAAAKRKNTKSQATSRVAFSSVGGTNVSDKIKRTLMLGNRSGGNTAVPTVYTLPSSGGGGSFHSPSKYSSLEGDGSGGGSPSSPGGGFASAASLQPLPVFSILPLKVGGAGELGSTSSDTSSIDEQNLSEYSDDVCSDAGGTYQKNSHHRLRSHSVTTTGSDLFNNTQRSASLTCLDATSAGMAQVVTTSSSTFTKSNVDNNNAAATVLTNHNNKKDEDDELSSDTCREMALATQRQKKMLTVARRRIRALLRRRNCGQFAAVSSKLVDDEATTTTTSPAVTPTSKFSGSGSGGNVTNSTIVDIAHETPLLARCIPALPAAQGFRNLRNRYRRLLKLAGRGTPFNYYDSDVMNHFNHIYARAKLLLQGSTSTTPSRPGSAATITTTHHDGSSDVMRMRVGWRGVGGVGDDSQHHHHQPIPSLKYCLPSDLITHFNNLDHVTDVSRDLRGLVYDYVNSFNAQVGMAGSTKRSAAYWGRPPPIPLQCTVHENVLKVAAVFKYQPPPPTTNTTTAVAVSQPQIRANDKWEKNRKKNTRRAAASSSFVEATFLASESFCSPPSDVPSDDTATTDRHDPESPQLDGFKSSSSTRGGGVEFAMSPTSMSPDRSISPRPAGSAGSSRGPPKRSVSTVELKRSMSMFGASSMLNHQPKVIPITSATVLSIFDKVDAAATTLSLKLVNSTPSSLTTIPSSAFPGTNDPSSPTATSSKRGKKSQGGNKPATYSPSSIGLTTSPGGGGGTRGDNATTFPTLTSPSSGVGAGGRMKGMCDTDVLNWEFIAGALSAYVQPRITNASLLQSHSSTKDTTNPLLSSSSSSAMIPPMGGGGGGDVSKSVGRSTARQQWAQPTKKSKRTPFRGAAAALSSSSQPSATNRSSTLLGTFPVGVQYIRVRDNELTVNFTGSTSGRVSTSRKLHSNPAAQVVEDGDRTALYKSMWRSLSHACCLLQKGLVPLLPRSAMSRGFPFVPSPDLLLFESEDAKKSTMMATSTSPSSVSIMTGSATPPRSPMLNGPAAGNNSPTTNASHVRHEGRVAVADALMRQHMELVANVPLTSYTETSLYYSGLPHHAATTSTSQGHSHHTSSSSSSAPGTWPIYLPYLANALPIDQLSILNKEFQEQLASLRREVKRQLADFVPPMPRHPSINAFGPGSVGQVTRQPSTVNFLPSLVQEDPSSSQSLIPIHASGNHPPHHSTTTTNNSSGGGREGFNDNDEGNSTPPTTSKVGADGYVTTPTNRKSKRGISFLLGRQGINTAQTPPSARSGSDEDLFDVHTSPSSDDSDDGGNISSMSSEHLSPLILSTQINASRGSLKFEDNNEGSISGFHHRTAAVTTPSFAAGGSGVASTRARRSSSYNSGAAISAVSSNREAVRRERHLARCFRFLPFEGFQGGCKYSTTTPIIAVAPPTLPALYGRLNHSLHFLGTTINNMASYIAIHNEKSRHAAAAASAASGTKSQSSVANFAASGVIASLGSSVVGNPLPSPPPPGSDITTRSKYILQVSTDRSTISKALVAILLPDLTGLLIAAPSTTSLDASTSGVVLSSSPSGVVSSSSSSSLPFTPPTPPTFQQLALSIPPKYFSHNGLHINHTMLHGETTVRLGGASKAVQMTLLVNYFSMGTNILAETLGGGKQAATAWMQRSAKSSLGTTSSHHAIPTIDIPPPMPPAALIGDGEMLDMMMSGSLLDGSTSNPTTTTSPSSPPLSNNKHGIRRLSGAAIKGSSSAAPTSPKRGGTPGSSSGGKGKGGGTSTIGELPPLAAITTKTPAMFMTVDVTCVVTRKQAKKLHRLVRDQALRPLCHVIIESVTEDSTPIVKVNAAVNIQRAYRGHIVRRVLRNTRLLVAEEGVSRNTIATQEIKDRGSITRLFFTISMQQLNKWETYERGFVHEAYRKELLEVVFIKVDVLYRRLETHQRHMIIRSRDLLLMPVMEINQRSLIINDESREMYTIMMSHWVQWGQMWGRYYIESEYYQMFLSNRNLYRDSKHRTAPELVFQPQQPPSQNLETGRLITATMRVIAFDPFEDGPQWSGAVARNAQSNMMKELDMVMRETSSSLQYM